MTEVGRNEPCPCGSGKKYKRCCGVSAAPKLGVPKTAPGGTPGFDPSQAGQMDPQMMMQLSQAIQRLPRGQMQRLQSIMQKAMSGKDVSREAEEFEKTLPVEFQSMLQGFKAPESPSASILPETNSSGMTEADAKRIVEQAIAEGKISEAQAAPLLNDSLAQGSSNTGKFGKFLKNITGKNG